MFQSDSCQIIIIDVILSEEDGSVAGFLTGISAF